MPDLDFHVTDSFSLARVRAWWIYSRDKWAKVSRIDELTPDEIAALADDIGVSNDELVRLVHLPDGTAGLLERRLRSLGLDEEQIVRVSPAFLGELQRTCASCPEKQRCAEDFAEDENPTGWESYCANAGTLRTLT